MSKSSFKRRIPTASSAAAGSLAGASAQRAVPSISPSEEEELDGTAVEAAASTSKSSSSSLPLPPGVRPSHSSSFAPLFSTGVAALDDVLSGSGLSGSSIMLIVPSVGTNPLPPTMGPQEGMDELALTSAEAYTELLLKYGAAQGLHAGHEQIVVVSNGQSWVKGLMRRIGEDEQEEQENKLQAKLSQVTLQEKKAEADKASSSSDLKIAFRYDKLPRLSSPFSGGSAAASSSSNSSERIAKAKEESLFCAQYDLSKSVLPQTIETGGSKFHYIDPQRKGGDLTQASLQKEEDDVYDAVLDDIKDRAKSLREQIAQDGQPRALRISILSFGSNAWHTFQSSPGAEQQQLHGMVTFLLQLKSLLRRLSFPTNSTDLPLPSVASISLSASMLASLPSLAPGVDFLQRMLHLSDAAISLSSFAVSPMYTSAFPGYTGSIQVLKTPAIGTLSDISIRASILRGMSSLAAGSSSAGGAGGGENNLAFKVKRKRIVIEPLNLDIPPDERETRKEPVRQQPAPAPIPPAPAASRQEPAVAQEPPQRSKSEAPRKPAFAGLKSLRQRGLQVKKDEPTAGPRRVEIDGGDEDEPQARPRRVPPVFSSDASPKMLDF